MVFGQLLPQKPPRYDAEERLVSPMGAMAGGRAGAFLPPAYAGFALPQAQPGYMVPPGYTLVPLGAGSPSSGAKTQASGVPGNLPAGVQKSPQNNAQPGPGRRSGQVNQVGASQHQNAPLGTRGGHGSRYGPPPLRTKEERLANYRRYMGTKNPAPPAEGQAAGFTCFYCGYPGHFARECKMRQQDLSTSSAAQIPKEEGGDKPAENGQQT